MSRLAQKMYHFCDSLTTAKLKFLYRGFPLNFERFGNSSGGVELSLYEILSVCGRIGKIAQRTDTDPQNPSLNVIL